MVSTDPIADMLTRIRNAVAINRSEVSLPHSNAKERIANILAENDFIREVSVDGDGIHRQLKLVIKRDNENSDITEIARLSSPGRRYYSKADAIPSIKRGRGLVIISTSQGVMTGDQAKAKRLGGELICKVY